MPKILGSWKVLPHDPMEEVDERLLCVSGLIPMPLGNFPRRMTVVGLSGNRSAIWSAIAQPDNEMRRIEALGTPSFLVVPNGNHRLDAKIWKERYPAIKVVTPPGARKKVEEIAKVDATEDIFEDPDVDFVAVPGTEGEESALVVTRASGTTLIVNDIIGNVQHPKGIGANIMARLLRWGTSGPAVPRTAKMHVKDAEPVARQLEEWAALPDLRRVIVSHGDIIENDPAGVLRKIAKDYRG